MKRHLVRNLSVLGVVLTLCVALVGVGYGHWSETLHIDGFAKWSALFVEITQQETNDPVGHWFDYHDPQVQGADESIMNGFQGSPFRLWKDVGWTDCVLLDTDDDGYRDTCEFTVNNAYPSYFGKLTLRVMNQSTDAWIQVDSVNVEYPASPEFNFDSPPIVMPPWPHPEGFEVQWTNGAWNLPIKIPPGQSTYLGCEIHVLQPDTPNWDTTYVFRIKFNLSGPVEP